MNANETARRCLDEGLRLARMAGAAGLAAKILGHLSLVATAGNRPDEGLAFADCGRFWIPGQNAESAERAERISICSAGAGVRINAAGLVFEFDAVRPLGSASQGWRLGVNFLPGF